MIQTYKRKPVLADSYDTIIIGSGMGGLTTAAILSKEGQKVLVLERHYTAGGFTHIFKRKGYEWDVGIHYIGEVQRPNSITKRCFDYISDSNLKWADMGEVYDRIYIGDKAYDFVKDVKKFKQKLCEYFPEEKDAIDGYVNLVFASTKATRKYFAEKALPPLLSKIIGKGMRKPFLEFSNRTTYEVLSSLTKNEELIKVLTGQYGDYGLPPKKSSFSMHASLVRHYFSGGSFPIGGSSQIVETIDPVIEAAGGTILINADVDKIIIENNKATGVLMVDGKTFHAKNIISAAGLMTTYKKLIPDNVRAKHKFDEQMTKVQRSVAHACLYIGLKGSPEELKLPKTNFWIYPEGTDDHDTTVDNFLKDNNAPLPVVYVSFPSAKDPDWSNRYPGKSTIDIITLEPYENYEKWDGTKWMKRGKEYEEQKEKTAQRLLNILYKHLPHLKGSIDYYELSSPLTTQHFVNYDEGEIYGIDHTPERFRQKFLRPRTPIKNFYLTGQDIVTAGVAGALFAGVLTASVITKKNIIKSIMSN
ncbi:phytoene desaturase family protein [Maribacter sp. HTCC2170]|uniref:phytoene desaturase family protein n=1 Tax=Maribacter sp. (strain HTCC2170 / KCCM 42371) TaxID=313603 RepID=UPI00006AFD25|nr:NAD(P)/FAD-dependent oxidoreductase [Maribacter sp. HTCC2170]EAR01455.1 Phytoene dehydrogenase and related protein [Maribacter sp. HTCC2170]